jgi:hypothetical protein
MANWQELALFFMAMAVSSAYRRGKSRPTINVFFCKTFGQFSAGSETPAKPVGLADEIPHETCDPLRVSARLETFAEHGKYAKFYRILFRP